MTTLADAPALSDAQSAAVLVMLLGEDEASRLVGQLDASELTRLGETMCALGEIGPDEILQAIDGFVARAERLGIHAHGRADQVRALMTRAVGEVKADNLMQRILPEAPTYTALELTQWLNPQAIVPLVQGEHPQAIAVLLVQLDPDVAAKVLHSLPAEQQTQVVHRVATMGPVAPEALDMLEELLSRRIELCHGRDMLTMGGTGNAAEIMNSSGKVVEKRVMPEIAKIDKNLARQIESEMFKFEHLYVLDPQSMGSLLREVESDTLINALKGIAEESREVFFRAMSSRAAEGVKDEIATRGRLKMADCIEAQKQIIATARALAAEGVIAFGGGEDEYV
ncbi:MAG TPA: flagellar motor switch protein FliG [Novosphingobium sp.]|nr:flagellar motor switch protein FliG [Novosphingobium sp.]HZV08598.1 flagellar motor switch protein FliG [Novosphingobium sp.]